MHSVFLPKAPTNTEKYSYIIRRPLLLKSLYVMSLLCWLGVLLGYIKFFEYNVWYWLIFGPLVLYITLYHFISISINLFYQRFDIKKHNTFRDTYWKANTRLPVIDVFLPVCGEDKKILENTWKGVLTMKNAKKYIIKPIVLDDKGDKNVEKLARKFKFRYLSRPNKGEMKKAGNLKYGYEKTHGEFMIIFDADFCPRHDFIEELLPYMQDKTRGIVQSPQFFDHDENAHKRSALECGAANVQTYFYKIIQTSRDTFGGSICVGSCAIYRRKALDSIGGTAQVEHSEDVHTGFRLISKKWKIKYIPLPLSK